ncbi:MAG TPA: hypothetical protein VGH08_12860 [Chthoniobacterales bacterium]|jgi:hypothetical protein
MDFFIFARFHALLGKGAPWQKRGLAIMLLRERSCVAGALDVNPAERIDYVTTPRL